MVTRPHGSPVATPVVSLDDPALYISRELSWVEFNDRVLEEALDAGNPLMERLKFVEERLKAPGVAKEYAPEEEPLRKEIAEARAIYAKLAQEGQQ